MAEIDSAMEEKLLGDDQNAEGKKEGGILLQGSMYILKDTLFRSFIFKCNFRN